MALVPNVVHNRGFNTSSFQILGLQQRNWPQLTSQHALCLNSRFSIQVGIYNKRVWSVQWSQGSSEPELGRLMNNKSSMNCRPLKPVYPGGLKSDAQGVSWLDDLHMSLTPYLLAWSIPFCSADWVSANICPVDIVILWVPVQSHSTANVSKGDDIIWQVICVKADPTDVHPSGKKQELVKTWSKVERSSFNFSKFNNTVIDTDNSLLYPTLTTYIISPWQVIAQDFIASKISLGRWKLGWAGENRVVETCLPEVTYAEGPKSTIFFKEWHRSPSK